MTSRVEKYSLELLKIINKGRFGQHVKRFAPVIGPVLWKIDNLPHVVWDRKRTRQIGFYYEDKFFKVKFSHTDASGERNGRLVIVEDKRGRQNEPIVSINNLDEAMRLDLRYELDKFISPKAA